MRRYQRSLPALRALLPAVIVFKTLDVVFVEMLAMLHLDEHEVLGAGILDPVRVTTVDSNVFAGRHRKSLRATRHPREAIDYDPMLRTQSMTL